MTTHDQGPERPDCPFANPDAGPAEVCPCGLSVAALKKLITDWAGNDPTDLLADPEALAQFCAAMRAVIGCDVPDEVIERALREPGP